MSRLGLVLLAALLSMASPGPARPQVDLAKGHDGSAPIEITSDTLDVKQNEQIAIFRGNVDAIQGEMNLRADELTVHYRSDAEGNNSISLIVAVGNVFLTSPTEMAQGDRGVYDIDAGTVVLTGEVVVTRDDNVIRGSRLRLNLATGKSKMEGGSQVSGDQGRVKAIFVPAKKNQ